MNPLTPSPILDMTLSPTLATTLFPDALSRVTVASLRAGEISVTVTPRATAPPLGGVRSTGMPPVTHDDACPGGVRIRTPPGPSVGSEQQDGDQAMKEM